MESLLLSAAELVKCSKSNEFMCVPLSDIFKEGLMLRDFFVVRQTCASILVAK